MKLRKYQESAVTLIVEDALTPGIHPVCVAPTGSGKSVIMCEIINRILTHDPTWNILILSHTEEICVQNHTHFYDYFGGIEIGLYHAGLDSRTIEKITVAGIQSACRNKDEFGRFDFIIIDEAHAVPTSGEGQYRTFLKGFDNYIGMTATHFRLGHGYIHEGEGAIFNKISINLSSGNDFLQLQKDGHISTIHTKSTAIELDVNDIRTRLGDFVVPDMSKKFNRDEITSQAVKEIVEIGKGYYKWLVFAIDIEHAEAITEELKEHGIKAACIHSKMKGNRQALVEAYKTGDIECVVNVDIFTAGFDAPRIDLIVLMRPTKSPVLHVQSIGRGLRVHRLKDHCLVLDFAGNTNRLGPINDIQIDKKSGKKNPNAKPMMKTCVECGYLIPIQTRVCSACGLEFEFQKGKELSNTASNGAVVSGWKSKESKWGDGRELPERDKMSQWQDVSTTRYQIWDRPGKIVSVMVEYRCGLQTFREWVLLNHKGWARNNSMRWVERRWTGARADIPNNTYDLYKNSKFLRTPSRIKVDFSQKFNKVEEHKF